MEAVNFSTGIPVLTQNDKIGVRLISMSGAELVEIRLDSRAVIPPHTTAMDVLFYVTQGSCSITLGQTSISAYAGDALAGPAGIPHGIENPHELPASVLVIKLPA